MAEVEDAASSKNPLNRLRNFETTVRKEEATAKDWEQNWGFMKVQGCLCAAAPSMSEMMLRRTLRFRVHDSN